MTFNRWSWLNTRRSKTRRSNLLRLNRYWKCEILLFCDFDLWLWYSNNLDIVMIYFHTSNKVSRSIGSEVISYKQKFLVLYCHDLDLGPMTLILKLDLDNVYQKWGQLVNLFKSYHLQTETQADAQTDRWTDRQTDMCRTFAYPLSLAVIKVSANKKRTSKLSTTQKYDRQDLWVALRIWFSHLKQFLFYL